MSLENKDQNLWNQSTNHDLKKKSKTSYTREFLLSLSELDICKELPSGFDRSILSEFDDAFQDRQRSTGSLSMHNFRRNEYGSSPPTRGDMSSSSRGVHGKWETRSSGRSDRDSDSRSEWDSDSGKHFGNQSRRSWQGPEHDGLLGSGSFPRPSGYSPGLSGPKFQSNGNYQQNRSNEPYQPPRPYKAPHSRRDTDSYNDETFGSLECTSEDRVEEERKRRASFELMRKEQQKAFQEKQKLNPDKNKDDFDITLLLDEDEKRLFHQSSESMEPPLTLMASSNDSEKSSFLAQTSSATRPLIPPGFTSAIYERNLVAQTSVNTNATEVGRPELGDARGNHIFDINSENKEEQLAIKHADVDQHHHQGMSLNILNDNEKERILDFSSIVDVPDIKIEIGDQLRKKSALLIALEASDNSEVIQMNTKVEGNESVEPFNQDSSNSILDKLFGNVLTQNGVSSSSAVEPDHKADETWSPHASLSSKFAHWFVEEEKKPVVDDSAHRPSDLLSLIVGGEKGGLQVPDVKTTKHSAPDFPFQISEPAGGHMTSNIAYTTISNTEQPYNSDKPEVPAVLTCEDLEQSILSQVNENGSSIQLPTQDEDFNAKSEESNSNVDDQASVHLLSLLQKGTFHKDMEPSIQDVDSIDKVHNTEGATTGDKLDNPGEANAEVSNSLKTLTLETLFGTAFMKELQSIGAPLSVQRGSIESAGADFSESPLFPFADNSQPPTGELALNRHENGVLPREKIHEPKPNRFMEQWLASDNCQGDANSLQHQSEFSKSGGFNGPTGIHLPEEDSLVAAGDPLQNFISAAHSAKAELSEDTPVDIVGKLTALNPAFRDEQRIVGNPEGLAYSRGPYDMREPGFPYQNLNVQRSSPQLHPSHLNHMGQMFNQPRHINSYIKQLTPEGIIHHDSTPNQFPGNMLRPPYHQPSTEQPGFDSPAHPSMLQQMHLQGNLPPPHLLQGFSRCSPLPAHPSNPMANFMQEPNPMQGFPFSGHQQPTFGGPGIPLQAHDVTGGRNHPEALQRLFEMKLRSNSKMVHPLAAGGHSQGTYGQALDLSLGYR